MKDIETDPTPDLDLDWSVVRPARMNAEMMHALLDAGLLDGRKVELIRGELVEFSPSKTLRGVEIDPELKRNGLHPAPVSTAMMHALLDAGALRDRRYELIQGRLVEMAPAKYLHGSVATEVVVRLRNAGGDRFSYALDAALFFSDDTTVGPDFVVLPRGMSSDNTAGPDVILLVEISNSTLPHDLGAKAKLYAMHGVGDYWVVDVPHRLIHVHRDPSADGYASVAARPWTEPVTALRAPALTLSLPEDLAP